MPARFWPSGPWRRLADECRSRPPPGGVAGTSRTKKNGPLPPRQIRVDRRELLQGRLEVRTKKRRAPPPPSTVLLVAKPSVLRAPSSVPPAPSGARTGAASIHAALSSVQRAPWDRRR